MRCSAPILLLLGVAALSGCSLISPTKEDLTLAGSSPKGAISLGELEREIRDLADCYVMGVAEACDRIKRQAPDAATRRSTHMIKLRNAASAYDVVAASDPLEALLDLLTLIELQGIVWLDEGRLRKLPAGPGREFLARTLEKSRSEAWALAERAIDRKHVGKVREVIHDWRRRNPDIQYVAFARFSSGEGNASTSVLNDVRSSIGGLINPFGSTTRSVDQTRDVAAQALFYSKRLPMILEWEMEAAAQDVADIPVLNSLTRLPAQGRSLVRFIGVVAAALLLSTFSLLLLYKRISLGWQRPAPSGKPPTRILPAP
ncbi:MAG TPA: hypothetical protein VE981_13025 [Planctomycetota bacterium]|nr:hypothetical protein [Planctomycetota bacterium]